VTSNPTHDVIIIGGGPAGATTGMLLARAGVRAVVLEKTTHPRFHIGESLLPRNYELLGELGLLDAVKRIPRVPKFGAEFAIGDGSKEIRFDFLDSFAPNAETFNVERAVFDKVLLDECRAAGADVREQTAVKRIVRMSDGDVAVEISTGETLTGKYLVDASGQSTVVARHLGTKKPSSDPHLQKVAYFGHFEGVKRHPGREEGHPAIVMADEGWFWLIHINERVTSIGMVLDANVAKQLDVPADRMLAWGMARCPFVRERCANATGPDTNEVISNFSYRCRPYAGPGHFLVGDAAAFLDPIFSTGVCLGMMQARELTRHLLALLNGRTTPDQARQGLIAFTEDHTAIYFRVIRQFYSQSFRELFLNGSGPVQMHRAVLAVLAGNVFPRPAWKLRWRLMAFDACVRINTKLKLVPRQNHFSLLATEPRPFGRPATAEARAAEAQLAAS
jgi:flavin-dependent dehydrogenase